MSPATTADTLAELLTAVVTDASTAVRAAAAAQTANREELQAARDSQPAALVDESVVDDTLATQCPRLARPPTGLVSDALDDDQLDSFHAAWAASDTAVRTGNVYVDPWRGDTALSEEFPPIRRQFGVELSGDDVETTNGVRLLTEAGVGRVRSAVARQVGRRRQRAIRGMAADGVPSVAVEGMEVVIPTVFDGGESRLTARPAGDDDTQVGQVGLDLAVERG